MEEKVIKSENIVLRAPDLTDAKAYQSWINDPETNKWRGLYHPMNTESADAWIREQSQSAPDRLTFAIMTSGSSKGHHVGFIGLRSICPRSRRAELWIYIGDKKAWNKGFGQQSVRALCRYAFDEMNLHRIWMLCDPESDGAVKCYAAVGFQKEGLLRQDYYRRGKYRDACLMGLLRGELKEPGKGKRSK